MPSRSPSEQGARLTGMGLRLAARADLPVVADGAALSAAVCRIKGSASALTGTAIGLSSYGGSQPFRRFELKRAAFRMGRRRHCGRGEWRSPSGEET